MSSATPLRPPDRAGEVRVELKQPSPPLAPFPGREGGEEPHDASREGGRSPRSALRPRRGGGKVLRAPIPPHPTRLIQVVAKLPPSKGRERSFSPFPLQGRGPGLGLFRHRSNRHRAGAAGGDRGAAVRPVRDRQGSGDRAGTGGGETGGRDARRRDPLGAARRKDGVRDRTSNVVGGGAARRGIFGAIRIRPITQGAP